jgi:hypothetical protein
MSWQAYVDDHLLCDIDGQRLSAAAILGHDGAVWAQSDAFPQVRLPPWLHPSHLLSAPHSFRRDRASKRILKQIVVDANVALTPVIEIMTSSRVQVASVVVCQLLKVSDKTEELPSTCISSVSSETFRSWHSGKGKIDQSTTTSAIL